MIWGPVHPPDGSLSSLSTLTYLLLTTFEGGWLDILCNFQIKCKILKMTWYLLLSKCFNSSLPFLSFCQILFMFGGKRSAIEHNSLKLTLFFLPNPPSSSCLSLHHPAFYWPCGWFSLCRAELASSPRTWPLRPLWKGRLGRLKSLAPNVLTWSYLS